MWSESWNTCLWGVEHETHIYIVWGLWNTCLRGVECVHLGSIHTVLLWQNTAKCYLSPFPAPFILAWKPLLRLASWFSLPLSLEGVRMLLPYPGLLKRHFIAKEVLVQWKAKWGYLSMAPCAHRVPWGDWTPEAVGMIYQVASWELWKSYISNSGHCQSGQSDPYVVKLWHLLIQPCNLFFF